MQSNKEKIFVLEDLMPTIKQCFGELETMEEIIQALKDDGSEWALKQVDILNKMVSSLCKFV